MQFLKSLVSKKLAVTAAAVALISSLPMTADWKGICTAAVAFAYVLAQAYVDAKSPGVPPVVGLLLLGVALAVSSASLPACSGKGADSAMVERSAALAVTGAAVALEVLTAPEVAYLDSLAKPTPEQLTAAEARNARLHRARESLLIVRGWLEGEREGGKQALSDALQALEYVADELGTQGVKIPERVTDGIRLAKLFVGLS